ncbi:unnamed protein product [Effrenium voratum]|nr:unnamed protein product [Effrenium voratum]
MASLGHGFQCLSVCALLFACSKSVLFAAARVEDVTSRQHILVHITDPQPGMLNMYTHPEDWAAEETMFSRLVAKAAGLRPSLVFVGGDMQNWWPNENSSADRNRPRKDMPDEDFEELKRKDLGKLQRNAARRSVQTLVSAGIPVVYTAGNHDVGDFPDESTLAQYTSSDSENPGWGPLFQKVKKEDGVLYLQFNSQIYWSTEASMETHRSQQLEFLHEEMSNIGDVRQLVLLTHIPPFMDSVDEEEGWANWKEHYRKEVLDVLAAPKIPMPTPGWLFNEIIRDVRNNPKDTPDVAEYLMQCVCSDQLNIQLKGVLCIKHIASEDVTFQNYLCACPGALKIMEDIAAPPIVPQARAIEPQEVRTVRDATKSALEALRTPPSVEKSTAGASLKARCQGFGNYEPPPEEEPTKKAGVAGQAADFVADSIGDMVDDFREKGAVGALKDATIDALDLVLDGVDTIWGWVAGSKETDQPRICQPTNQPQMPGQFQAAGSSGYSGGQQFQAPAAPKTSANHYAAAFGGGVVGANNPVMVGGLPNGQPSQPASYQSYTGAATSPAPAASPPEEPKPKPVVDLLSMDEPKAPESAAQERQKAVPSDRLPISRTLSADGLKRVCALHFSKAMA